MPMNTRSASRLEFSIRSKRSVDSSRSSTSRTIEAKQQLGTIISLEKTYFYSNNAYVAFAAGADCPEIGYKQPGGRFIYSFNTSKLIAIAKENGVENDINDDGDGDDGLTLSIKNVRGVLSGSSGNDLSW